MKHFKFLKENDNFTPELNFNNTTFTYNLGGMVLGNGLNTLNGSIVIAEPEAPVNYEFVFQFDDDEPVAFTQGNLSIFLSASAQSSIAFNNNDKSFKIYTREV